MEELERKESEFHKSEFDRAGGHDRSGRPGRENERIRFMGPSAKAPFDIPKKIAWPMVLGSTIFTRLRTLMSSDPFKVLWI